MVPARASYDLVPPGRLAGRRTNHDQTLETTGPYKPPRTQSRINETPTPFLEETHEEGNHHQFDSTTKEPKTMTLLKTSLWCCSGTSDKVYIVTLNQYGHLFSLTALWGRRGKTLTGQVKGNFTDRWQATREFHSLVASKTAKGYQVTERVTA